MSAFLSKNNICILIPYFGRWPVYFNIFLKSCGTNSSFIDYIFFTDNDEPVDYPRNVSFIQFSIQEVQELASKKLETPVKIIDPYKLCDFKPSYGLIFSDYLGDYKYWGHGDEDLILGNLSGFLPELIKINYDLISVREEWISGPFCLYRNVPKVNLLFQKSSSYPEVYLKNHYMAFDECSGLFAEIREGKSILDIDENQSMTYLVKKEILDGNLKVFFKTLIKESLNNKDFLLIDHGTILLNGQIEYLAYHYITEKKKFCFNYPSWSEVPDKYYIDTTGFFRESEWNNRFSRLKIRWKRQFFGIFKRGNYYLIRFVEKYFIK